MTLATVFRSSVFFLIVIQARSLVVAQMPVPYRITGVVVSSTNGSPIPHCRLTPSQVVRGRVDNRRFPPPQNAQDYFEADEYGHFSIPVPSAGAWRLIAAARGFVTQAYDEHQQFSSAIVLTAAAPTVDLRFQLAPEAVVTGIVLDEASEPVRNAKLSLLTVPPVGPDHRSSPTSTRAVTQTDDRGIYEFANVVPGDYQIMLQAQPWYAAAAQLRRFGPADAPSLDSSLDVTYPLTWFPGVDAPTVAETLTLHGGDTRQADFHLTPIPSIHLRIVPPPTQTQANGRAASVFPFVERLTPGGDSNLSFTPVSVNINPQGQIDVGGLAPGLYQIRLQGQGSDSRPSLVAVASGTVRTVDFDAPSDMANIALRFDSGQGPQTEGGSIQVRLIDADTRQTVFPYNSGLGGVRNLRLSRQPATSSSDSVLQVPPGRYEVVLFGKPDVYLTGITARSAEVTGRIIKVHSGDSSITVHIATGRATLTGVATLAGNPSVGAMVLLVPASLGDPASITILRRDQTNTDGSFDLADILPGQYILLAIDHGWQINWSDPSTLRGYLMHGVPVDLTSSANVSQNIEAQAP
jgi:hypothetical protein